ncbi:MAG: hypothetical protein M3347_14760, partial [Armatimonadota bacterium]|nr:hypothetical protein [Armatimonadota bacterium]
MNRTLSRSLFSLLFVCWFWGVFSTAARAETSASASPVTNATPAELRAIEALLARLDRAVAARDPAARDPAALRLLGVADAKAFEKYRTLTSQRHITHLATGSSGALLRQVYRVSGVPDSPANSSATPITLSSGSHELWLQRMSDGAFAFSTKSWQPPTDAVAALAEAARQEWEAVTAERAASTGQQASTKAKESAEADDPGDLLHLVAEQRGGRWIALRRSHWRGGLLDAVH